MKNIPTVSIAMATYNGACFIGEQLASFASQGRLPDELVVADDCSADDTLEIVERFAATAPFAVRICRNARQLGVNRNFEQAIRLASGDLVFISDQDDIWYPAKIERVVSAIAARPRSLALYHDEHILDQSSGQMLEGTVGERARTLGIRGLGSSVGKCTVLRREIVPLLMPFPHGFSYDEWINWLPDLLEARLVIDSPLQIWRRHDDNVSQPAIAAHRASRWRSYREHTPRDPRPGWAEEVRRLEIVRDRIAERGELIDELLGTGSARDAIARADVEIARLRERIALVGLPMLSRWLRVAGRWSAGFYRPFSGWKSALKDAFLT